MALTTAVFTITMSIPSKFIAFSCGIIAFVLMMIAVVSPDWLTTAGWQQGLFAYCIEEHAPTPLPFNVLDPPDCYPIFDDAYIRAAAALCITSLLADIIATILTGLGLRSIDHGKKCKYYRIALLIMNFSLMSGVIGLILYPFFLITKLREGNRTFWELSWTYGIGWSAVSFLAGAVFLLLSDEESEVIYYKEYYIE